jgi:hypothetical protein
VIHRRHEIGNDRRHNPHGKLADNLEAAVRDLPDLVRAINPFRQTTAWQSLEARMPRSAQRRVGYLLDSGDDLVACLFHLFSIEDDPVRVPWANPFLEMDTAIRGVAAHAILDRSYNRLKVDSFCFDWMPGREVFDDLLGAIMDSYREGVRRRASRFGSAGDPVARDFRELIARVQCEAADRLGLSRPCTVLHERVVAHFEIFVTLVNDEELTTSQGCGELFSGRGPGWKTSPLPLSPSRCRFQHCFPNTNKEPHQ